MPQFLPPAHHQLIAAVHARWARACAITCRWIALAVCVGLLSACQEELLGKVDETDANAALDVLYQEQIEASRTWVEGDLWRVDVDSEALPRARHLLRMHGIPRERFASMGDLFKKDSLVSTPAEMRIRYLFGVSQELSHTLSQIDGVTAARVHPVIPVPDALSDKSSPPSASVFIKYRPDADVQQLAPAIRTLVARSIEGLNADDVSLTFVPASNTPSAAWAPAPRWVSHTVVVVLAWLLGALALLTLLVVGWRLLHRRDPDELLRLSDAPAPMGEDLDADWLSRLRLKWSLNR